MKARLRIVLTLTLLAYPLAADDKAAEKPAAAATANPGAAGIGGVYGFVGSTLVRAAEKMPEESYSFKPSPDVRSFGQLVAHVVDAQSFICKTAMGDTAAYSDETEKGKTSKADLVAALKASNAACQGVFKQTDADLAKPVKMFGMSMNRFGAATIVVGHAYEHYGNMVTYMRMKGLVPPSSEQPPPAAAKSDAPKTDASKSEEKK
jgi:uncharacterized damage-inducible protein DinB